MARVIRFHKTGGPEVLQIDEVDIGAPGRGELRLRMHAFGLNRAEAMFRSGMYLEEPKLPGRLGYEAAGTVEAIGRGRGRVRNRRQGLDHTRILNEPVHTASRRSSLRPRR